MIHEVPSVAVARLRSMWDGQVRPSARRALAAAVFATFFGMAHAARVGTPLARGGGALALALAIVAVVVRALVLRRRAGDPRQVVRDTIVPTDPALGAATLRALSLVDRTAADDRAGSPALAALHLERLLGRVSRDRLTARAARAAVRWSGAGLAIAAATAAVVMLEPFRVVEGLDVLVAQDGVAPLPLAWIDGVEMAAAPPDYLHTTAGEIAPFADTSLPRGTTLTVRGRPLRAGRTVVLTDGHADVPFVDDGAGGVIARWTLGDSTTLQVAAVFGEVRVPQVERQEIRSIPDEVPRVVVDGAPRTVRLLDEPSIPIHYEATDDHGLREVDLVLRAGTREERRVLSHPTADALVDRGGYEVLARDSFFKKTYTPVEITVEARDNDTVLGPKWGKSAAITVIPPQVGEPEALRYAALLAARDAMTDLAAGRVTGKAPTPADAKAHVADEADAQAKAARAVNDALLGNYGGLSLRGRIVSLARGQLRRLERALEAEKKTPTAPAHQKLLEETEDALLALDSGVRALGWRDTQSVAKRLADVADEAAAALAAAGSSPDPKAGAPRIDAAVGVLDGGGKQLLKLGELGVDLGEIVAADLRRVARAREANDLRHAELAARDLAARLRRPEPSFSSGGGHGGGGSGGSGKGQGGVESGSPSGKGHGGEEGPSADDEAAGEQNDLEELARDHANEMGDVEEALERALKPEELEALRQEAKEHADAIREAVKRLPAPRNEAGSAESAAAAGREEAEAMAGALEGGRPRDAVESGRRSVEKLAEAQRLAEQSGGFFPEDRPGREAAQARPTIERELAWAQDALERLRSAAAARAKDELQKHGKNEHRLAERASDLAKKGDSGDRSMPQEMLDRLGDAERAMREAEHALEQGDGDKGLRKQREAQRFLEMAQGEAEEGGEHRGARDGEGKRPTGKADVPGKDKHNGPDEFRKRVLEGLGKSSDPLLRDAVKRYAEGLLK
jgi:hypothetical protein